VLRALGVGEAVAAAGTPIHRWTFLDQHGTTLCASDLRQVWGEGGGCVGIPRVRLHQALLAAAAAVPARLGISVTSLTQEGERVLVGFTDGSTGRYDLVVGADGVHSTVRRLRISTAPPDYAGTTVWRSLIPARPPSLTDMMLLMGDGCYFGLVPMGDCQTYSFGAVGGRRVSDPLTGRLQRFRDRFADFGGPVPAYLAALERDEQLHVGPMEWVDLDRWHSGRVVLIGDAAHAGPPNMAQGGCMAMEDALVLAEELRAADTVECALTAYVIRRRPRADWVQQQSRIAAQSWVLPASARNAVLRDRGDQMLRDRYRPLIPAA
jgi:2-polyprenyl-6-methoxyphenol hydroxylase-like FAD-dependent oxidoreductase